ncbi:MAG: hypothetical protein ACRENB_12680, partial [Gemmatimonadales bacterium]
FTLRRAADALTQTRTRVRIRRALVDSARVRRENQTPARENLANAYVSLGWYELFTGAADSALVHSRLVLTLDSTETYAIPNHANALLLLDRGDELEAIFARYGRATVELPRVPFVCAVVRDLERQLIPRGAARPEHLARAEDLARRHSTVPLTECPHRKQRPTP